MKRFCPFKIFHANNDTGFLAAPLREEEFAHLAAPFKIEGRRVAVAVSGGPDSMALAWCAKRWADQGSGLRAQGSGVVAFIVDHGLREESAAEAALVSARLAALGIESEVLRWAHDAVRSRVHVQARKARYDLLIEACKRRGITDLLLAHHQEDQAETILMRFAKGSGLDGLAGMAPVTTMDGARLLRPFLSVSKARLVATCEEAGIPYVIDPSNAKEKYARGRLRRVRDALADEGFTTERLADLGARAREAREALDHYTQALLRVAARMDVAGVVTLNLEQLRSAPQAVALRALGECLQRVHAGEYQPERAMLLPLLEALCHDGEMGARTLHGCVVGKTDRFATIVREYAAITDEKPIAPGETVVWDGRWQVHLSPDYKGGGLTVRALGKLTHEQTDYLAPGLRRLVPQGRARAAMPALWEGKMGEGEWLVMIPAFGRGAQNAALAYLPEMF